MTHTPRAVAGRRLSLELLEPRVVMAATDLRITEILASNEDGLADADGDNSDWLEIYNAGTTSVDMTGMYLTDDDDELDKWAFPAGSVIPAGGYRIVFASDKDGILGNGELHTNFKLGADGEYLALVAADGVTVIDAYAPEFPEQVEDISYGRSMAPSGAAVTIINNGAAARAIVPTNSAYDATWRSRTFNDSVFPISGVTGFGYENNPGDPINYTAEIATAVPNNTTSLYLRINFTLSTLSGIDQLTLRMRYDDGFVAYVNGQLAAEDNAPESPQWNSSASGTHDDAQGEQFIDFDISSVIPNLVVGQNVLAVHALNSPGSDMLVSPMLVSRSATIVTPEVKGYFDLPTPGYANGPSFLGFVDEPTFSVPHGMYSTTQSVAITSATPGAVIVYTTNGSTPAVNSNLVPTNGTLYTGPINVNSTRTLRAMAFRTGYKPSFVSASTYIFLNDVVTQSPTGTPPAGWPANGAVNGQQINYGIDPDIIAQYGVQAVKDSLASLPSISISTDLANLFNATTGIYVNALNDGRAWERAASVELMNNDGTPGFSTNAGLRIRGGYSRNDFNPKRAFRLYFRNEYGDGKLNYPLFGDEGTDEFDVIDLRTESNYSWSAWGSLENTFTREVFARDLMRDLGEQYTRSRYYHLYLDGQYFGIYQTQERIQEDYAASYFGGEPEDYDIVKAGRMDGGGTQVAEGNDAAWSQLFTLAQNLADNPAGNANNYWALQGLNPDGSRNPALPVLLDVENLVDYMLILWYTGGFDSGISRFFGENEANNWYGLYNRVAADQGFQFFVHDNEHSLGNLEGGYHGTLDIDRTGPFNAGNQSTFRYFNPVYLHQDLLSHPVYRQRITEKVGEYLTGNGPMTPAASIARMQQRIDQVDAAIIAEAARWGDSKRAEPLDRGDWLNEIAWLKNTYFPLRTNLVLTQIAADGLYFVPPTFIVPSGLVPLGNSVGISWAGTGTVYYTTNGTDPRTAAGGVSASAQVYTSLIPLTTELTLSARARLNTGEWSELIQATYTPYRLGDFQRDDVVNGSDFLTWQQQLGTTASPPGTGADANRSGLVDASDLLLWRTFFGTGAGLQAAATVAEEPAIAPAVVAEAADAEVIASTTQAFALPAGVLLSPATTVATPVLLDNRRERQRDEALAMHSAMRTTPWDGVAGRERQRPTSRGRFETEPAEHGDRQFELALDAALGDLL